MKVLLVVDVQNDFCPGGSLAVKDGDKVVDILNEARKEFDEVIFTQDWHPKNHKSFASNHAGTKVGEFIELNGRPQILWPNHCVQESLGAEFHPRLDTRKDDKVFRKGTNPEIDSYSAFYDNSHDKSTGLAEYLRKKSVKEITVGGLATDYCVLFTVLDALREGFEVEVLVPACRGVELKAGDSQKALEKMKREGARWRERL